MATSRVDSITKPLSNRVNNVLPVFQTNFTQLGTGSDVVFANGASDYIFYASGRKNCRYCYSFLELAPRHNLMRSAYNFLMNIPAEDLAVITFTLPRDINTQMVFGHFPIFSATEVKNSRYDLVSCER